ncbi:hypothetical protein D3C72_2034970 [compost metagenome]
MFQQGFSKLFLGLEVVIEGSFRNASGFDNLSKADGAITFMGDKRSGNINDVLTHVSRLFFHSPYSLAIKLTGRLVLQFAFCAVTVFCKAADATHTGRLL